jgi:phosphinothricin acetyltransferase
MARPDADGAALARIYAPYVTGSVISFEAALPAAEDMARRARNILLGHPYLVMENRGDVVGFAYGAEHRSRAAYRWSCDVSVYVAQDHHRQGIGRALYARLFELLRRQRLHLAFAGITLPNDNSIGLHEAMGFTHVGTYVEVGYKFGAWRDVGWWRLALTSGAAEDGGPPEPILFRDLLTAEGAV